MKLFKNRSNENICYGAEYWDNIAKDITSVNKNSVSDDYICSEIKSLVRQWCDVNGSPMILKTDLFEEAFRGPCWGFYRGIGNLVSIDISFIMAARARKRTGSLKCVVADVTELPFKDSAFDIIISHSTLDHISVESFKKALSELRRVIKNEGVMILTLDNSHNYLRNNIFKLKKKGILPCSIPWYTERFYSVNEVRGFLNSSGFKMTAYTPCCVWLPLLNQLLKMTSRLSVSVNKFAVSVVLKILGIIKKSRRASLLTARFVAYRCIK